MTKNPFSGKAAYCLHDADGIETLHLLGGRVRWCLERLMRAETKGCTPIDDPAPRWSAYVHQLREDGFDIETITEPHGGDFPGHHARYVLRNKVTRQSRAQP